MRVGRLVATTLAALAALVVGVAHLNITVHKSIQPVKIVTKHVSVPSVKLNTNGKVTAGQCYLLKRGMTENEVIAQYGYPSDYDPKDAILMYPVRGSRDRFCSAEFWDGSLDRVSLDIG